MSEHINKLYDQALGLLKELISIPSFSKEEEGTAGALARFLALRGIEHSWVGNNIYALNAFYDPSRPTLLLNSHHDTVKPNKSYTLDPFSPIEKDGKLFGLGSNDAGGDDDTGRGQHQGRRGCLLECVHWRAEAGIKQDQRQRQ